MSLRERSAELARFGTKGLFAGLGEAELSLLLAGARRRPIRAGETLMREGEPGDAMFLLAAGTVNVTKNLTLKLGDRDFAKADKSMTTIKAEHAPVFGEMALFGDAPRSATITAEEDCVVYEIGRGEFDELCAREPVIALAFIRRVAAVLSDRVRKGNEEVLKLSTALSLALAR